MNKPDRVIDAIDKEFSLYYLVDELNYSWHDPAALRREIEDAARNSARRFSFMLDEKGIKELARVLEEASHDAEHPVHEVIADASNFNWQREPYWSALSILLGSISKHLDGRPETSGAKDVVKEVDVS